MAGGDRHSDPLQCDPALGVAAMSEPDSIPGISDATLHKIEWLADWEYARTWAPLGRWLWKDTPPEGAGWVRNVEAADNGYEELERIQVSYWRRRKV